jgi:hypothetical protein
MRQAVSILAQAAGTIATAFAITRAHHVKTAVRQLIGKTVILVQATLTKHPNFAVTRVKAPQTISRQQFAINPLGQRSWLDMALLPTRLLVHLWFWLGRAVHLFRWIMVRPAFSSNFIRFVSVVDDFPNNSEPQDRGDGTGGVAISRKCRGRAKCGYRN